MHPLLDVHKLTDEDILSRLGKAYSYLNYQTALGHTPTVHSIRDVIDSLEGERANRLMIASATEHTNKYPNLLAPIELGKLEEQIRKSL